MNRKVVFLDISLEPASGSDRSILWYEFDGALVFDGW